MSNREVPTLSLKSFTEGSAEDQLKFVDTLYSALKEYGFIILDDHLIEQDKVDRAYEIGQQFFALEDEVKNQYGGVSGGQRGFTPFGKEHAKDNPNPDLKEFWHVGRELSSDSKYKDVYPANVWPDKDLPEFRKAYGDLYKAMDKTAEALLSAIGKALDVPANYFSEMIHDGNSILRLIHYPPVVNQDTKNSVRAAAHEDINLITLLVGATDSGLELLDRDGTWLPVKSKPGQIVVDTGDMMARLTNGILPATTHRVVNPDDTSTTRFSMPFFVHPHSEASLAILPQCVGEGKKWDDITAGEFLNQRLREIGLM
ncbi:MAG: isopenicillin N synthase family dioxygenase [Bacteriovoracaceae bacterium]